MDDESSIASTSKRCAKCGEEKPLSDFAMESVKKSKDGRKSRCKRCKASEEASRPNKNKFKPSTDGGNPLVGFTIHHYEAAVALQNGVCAICGRPETSVNQYGVKRLCIDHCHETGKFRGLLCTRCNTGLGFFQESPDILRQALAYLAQNGSIAREAHINVPTQSQEKKSLSKEIKRKLSESAKAAWAKRKGQAQ